MITLIAPIAKSLSKEKSLRTRGRESYYLIWKDENENIFKG